MIDTHAKKYPAPKNPRRRPLTTILIGALGFIACTQSPQVHGQPHARACNITELSRQILRDSAGTEIYVEPMAFLPSADLTLLAGTPNYAQTSARGGNPSSVRRDSFFGVVIDGRGTAQLVQSPVAGVPAVIRAAAYEIGSWHVVFAEYPAGYRYPEAEQVVALWYGILEGTRWRSLEKLPLPANARLHANNASALVVRVDTLSWALTYESRSGEEGVALFEKVFGDWKLELIPVPEIAFVALARAGDHRLVLLPARGDGSGKDANSVFRYERGARWQETGLLIRGGDEPVFDLQAQTNLNGTVLTWWSPVQHAGTTRHEARALAHAFSVAPSDRILVDGDVAVVRPVASRVGDLVWIVTGPRGQAPVPVPSMEMRFTRITSAGERITARMPDPFDGPFAAYESNDASLQLAGPFLRRDPHNPALTTMLVRVSFDCKTP